MRHLHWARGPTSQHTAKLVLDGYPTVRENVSGDDRVSMQKRVKLTKQETSRLSAEQYVHMYHAVYAKYMCFQQVKELKMFQKQ